MSRELREDSMFKLIEKSEILNLLKDELENELSDLALILPEILTEVEKNILYGVFSNSHPYKINDFDFFEYTYLTHISYDLIKDIKEKLNIDVKFFNQIANEEYEKYDFKLYVNYSSLETLCKKEHKKDKEYNFGYTATVVPTLPDSETLFKSLIQDDLYNNSNEWLYEYMDKYDNFRLKLLSKYYNMSWQFGGYGNFIQSSYVDGYVGQANIDIGDSGSIILYYRGDELHSYVDQA